MLILRLDILVVLCVEIYFRENLEGAFKNGHSRDTGNIVHKS